MSQDDIANIDKTTGPRRQNNLMSQDDIVNIDNMLEASNKKVSSRNILEVRKYMK